MVSRADDATAKKLGKAAAAGGLLDQMAAVELLIATLHPGRRVVAVGYELEDAAEMTRIPIQPVTPAAVADEDGLSPRQQKMLGVCRQSPYPLNAKTISRRVNPAGDGSTTGSFGSELRALRGRWLFARDAMYTDDESKFDATT